MPPILARQVAVCSEGWAGRWGVQWVLLLSRQQRRSWQVTQGWHGIRFPVPSQQRPGAAAGTARAPAALCPPSTATARQELAMSDAVLQYVLRM